MKREWVVESTELFLKAAEALTDAQYTEPSALPGWTRAHVVAHVHFNALGLMRLVSWAATGTEQRMYASAQAREAEIEAGAHLSPTELRELVRKSSTDLIAAYDALSPAALTAMVFTARGRPIPASEIGWLRTRETAIHAVDLAGTVSWEDLPAGLTQAIATEALSHRTEQLPELTAYLTGRAGTAPVLGDWL